MHISLFFLPSVEACCQEISADDRRWLEEVGSLRFSEVDWESLSCFSEYPEYKGIIVDYLDIISEATVLELEIIQSITRKEVLEKCGRQEIDLIPFICSDYEKGTPELAEKLRLAVEQYDFPKVRSCTASFGVTSYLVDDDLTVLLRRADEALYSAKKSGKNRVIVHEKSFHNSH